MINPSFLPKIFLLFCFLIIGCAQEPTVDDINYEQSQKFLIKTHRDTIIKTVEGIEFHIKKKTFQTNKDEIEIYVNAAVDKSQMIEKNCITLTTDNRLLESDGMFSIQANPKVSINKDAPILVKMPTEKFASNMKIFKGKKMGEDIQWQEKNTPIQSQTLTSIENGKKVYQKNCTSCHSINLRKKVIGPALGNITYFRDSLYLLKFTQNSQKFLKEGKDIRANCVYEQYRLSVMSTFDSLSVKEIDDIYTFIKSESKNQGIGLNEISYPDSCTLTTDPRLFYDAAGNIIDSIPQFSPRIISNKAEKQLSFYEFEIDDYGWFNVDLYKDFPTAQIANFNIYIDSENVENFNAYAVFKNEKIIIPLNKYEDYYVFRYGEDKERINFPTGVEMRLIVLEQTESTMPYFASKDIVSKYAENVHSLTMKRTAKAEIVKMLDTK